MDSIIILMKCMQTIDNNKSSLSGTRIVIGQYNSTQLISWWLWFMVQHHANEMSISKPLPASRSLYSQLQVEGEEFP